MPHLSLEGLQYESNHSLLGIVLTSGSIPVLD
jgi:hypothetical protein